MQITFDFNDDSATIKRMIDTYFKPSPDLSQLRSENETLKQQLAATTKDRDELGERCEKFVADQKEFYRSFEVVKQRAEAAEARIKQLEAGAEKSLPMILRDGGECWECVIAKASPGNDWLFMRELKHFGHYLYRRRITLPKVLAVGWLSKYGVVDAQKGRSVVVHDNELTEFIPVAIVERSVQEQPIQQIKVESNAPGHIDNHLKASSESWL